MKKPATNDNDDDEDDAPPPPPPNSTSIISSLLRAELNMHVKQQAWDKIEQMLESNPDVARAVDPATGELPLHVLARKCNTRTLSIDLAILDYPEGLLHRDSNGQIPLHFAAESGSFEGLEIIYEAYKDGRKCFDNAGRLPIHVATEAKSIVATQYLLGQDQTLAMSTVKKTANVREDQFLGGLPIHSACRSGASEEIINFLLSKSATSAKAKDFQGNLPIHLLLKHGNSVELGSITVLLSAYSSSPKKKNSAGDLPLIIALKHGAKSDAIEYLFDFYPEAAEERSGDGRSPLTIAIENRFDDAVILKILKQSPAFATDIDEKTGLLPIEIATHQHFSPHLIHYLLVEDLPICLNDRGADPSSNYRSSYQHSWEHLIAVANDEYSEVVSNLLQSCTHAQRIALANAPCRLSEKPLLEVASPKCKRALLVGMRLFGIIALTDIAPAFVTNRTSIYYGLKYSEAPANGVNVVFEEEGEAMTTDLNGVATPVIVKLTSHRELMEKEISVRRDCQLSLDSVPRIYSVHYSEKPSPTYCISMEQGLTLENILLEIKGEDTNANIPMEDIRQIAMTLLHLHDKGLVHCDIGSHNVGKFEDGNYKLLSIGGAVPVGQPTEAERGWYFPPEAIASSSKKNKLKLKFKPKIVSIPAAHTLDLWAFGVMMYQLLCGVPLSLYAPSPDRNANVASVKSWNEKALSKALIHLRMKDETAADLLSGLLHPKPSRRIASMKQVLAHQFFSYEEQKVEKVDTGMALPPPSTDKTSEPSEVNPNDFAMKNVSDTIYPTQESRLQDDGGGKTDEAADVFGGETSHQFGGSTHSQEDTNSFFSYPTQNLRPKGANSSYPIQERRNTFPVQEMRGNITSESPCSRSSPTCIDTSGDQSVSSLLLGSNSVHRFDGDCFSTASTKFADNTSTNIAAMNHEVPKQVVTTEKKPERRDSGNERNSGQLSQYLSTAENDATTLQHAESYNSIDSDDESEPGRIIPGSRLRKRAATRKYHDPQLI